MLSGLASFVLPSYANTSYIDIEIGDHFGVIDIIGSANSGQFNLKNWIDFKNKLYRQFTIMAANNVECLVIDIKDISRVQKEFPDYYDDLLNDQIVNLQSAWIYKLKAMKDCRKQMEELLALEEESDNVAYNIKPLYIHQIDSQYSESSAESSHSCSHGGDA